MIYLDNSATTFPKPNSVKQAMTSSLSSYGANPGRGGYKMAIKTAEAIYRVRQKVDSFFCGYGPENVVFFGSCTSAINQVLFGKLKSGDHVLISDLEHNAVVRPLKALEEIGVSYTVVTTYPEDNTRTIDSFREEIRKNTKLIVCTCASNVWGIRLPIERLSALAHIYNIDICVDGAQGGGIIPINMREWGIDYLCLPAHKGLYGTMGLGILLIRDNLNLVPIVYGGTGVNSKSFYQPEDPPERYESGTINVPAILALEKGLIFLEERGIEKIHRSEMEKVNIIQSELSKIEKFHFYTGKQSEKYFVPVLSFTYGEENEIAEFYSKNDICVRTGLHCAPLAHEKFHTEKGTIRVSPSIFTTNKEIWQFINISKKYK